MRYRAYRLGHFGGKGRLGLISQMRPMGLPYMPISWGGFGGQCMHI